MGGNSKAIHLPKDFTDAMNLNMGDFLELEKLTTIQLKWLLSQIARKKNKTYLR